VSFHPDFDWLDGTLDVRVCGRRVPTVGEVGWMPGYENEIWTFTVPLGERPLVFDVHVRDLGLHDPLPPVMGFLGVHWEIEEQAGTTLKAVIEKSVIHVGPWITAVSREERMLQALDPGWHKELESGEDFWVTWTWLQTLETRSAV
jgi:hypothetical protein